METKPPSTESQECLPTSSGEATHHHHSCESAVGCVSYRCHGACSQPLGLSGGIKGREEGGQETPMVPELLWNTPGHKTWLIVCRAMPRGEVLFLSVRGTNQAGTGASGSKSKIAETALVGVCLCPLRLVPRLSEVLKGQSLKAKPGGAN